MSRIAIIPARSGSKRIPRKNIKLFLGKPIIAYSIESALASNLFDEVMVSTDDEEIANIAKEYGARVPFYRSTESATDYATTVDVLLEVLSQYNSQGIHFDLGWIHLRFLVKPAENQDVSPHVHAYPKIRSVRPRRAPSGLCYSINQQHTFAMYSERDSLRRPWAHVGRSARSARIGSVAMGGAIITGDNRGSREGPFGRGLVCAL